MNRKIPFLIRTAITWFLMAFFAGIISSQEKPKPGNIRFYFSDDKSSFAGISVLNQIWTRYVWFNPDGNGTRRGGDFDIGLRRSRIILYSNLFGKCFMYTQFGLDGQTFKGDRNPPMMVINAETEYKVLKDKLQVGIGLNTWNGVSRYNNSNVSEFLVVDNPGFAFPVGGTDDQLGRQFGIYAKGNLNRLNYRISAAKPFQNGSATPYNSATSELLNSNPAYKGYFYWQFFDREDQTFPYLTMNNLGRSKLLNVGAGIYYHPSATHGNWNDKYLINDIFLASIDEFLDLPLRNGGAVTSYLGINYYFFGKNYLRSMGVMNTGTSAGFFDLDQGYGNSEYETGTGTIVRYEAGYLFPKTILKAKLQPFGALTWKNFQGLDQSSVQFDAGINYLMAAHNMKWTLQYSSRPVYNYVAERNVIIGSRGSLIFQTQISF
jgi:hypothetical protein